MSADRIDYRNPPGARLVWGVVDPARGGFVEWSLAGRPVPDYADIELLVGTDRVPCDGEDCYGEGCPSCGGSQLGCWRYSPLWLRCRFETGAFDDGPVGWLHLPVHGTDARVKVTPSMRCRWPGE